MMKKTITRQIGGNLYALLSGVCVTGYFIINRYAYTRFQPSVEDYVSTFVFLAGIIASSSYLLRKLRNPSETKKPKNFPSIVGTALIASLGIALTVLAQKYTTAGNAAIIATFSVPVTIYTSHVILKQSIPRNKLPWILSLIVGVYLAVIGFNSYHLRSGDLIMVASCLLLGLTNTLWKPLLKDTSPANLRDYRFMTGGFLFGITILLLPGIEFTTKAGVYPLFAAFFFWSAIFCYYRALEQIGPAHAIVINNSHTAFTAFLGVLLLGESVSLSKLLGIGLVLFSIHRISERNKKHP